jgi:hypothetical protein
MLKHLKTQPGPFLFALFSCLAWLHPWHVHPFRTFYHDLLPVVALLLGWCLLRTHPVLPRIVCLPLGLMALMLLQWALGLVDASALYYGLMLLAMAALAMVLGASWAGQPGGVALIGSLLAASLLLAALLSVLMQWLQFFGIDLRPWVMWLERDPVTLMRPFANVGQPNQLALLLCFGLATLWHGWQAGRLAGGLAWGMALWLLTGLALSQSRIGWIIVPLFALSAASGMLGQRALARRAWPALLALLVLFVLCVWGLPTLGAWLGHAQGTRLGGARSERAVLMQQAWQMAKQHPWLGVGWQGFGPEQVRIAADFAPSTYSDHAHNIVLQFAAELGWPMTCLMVPGLLFWLGQCCVPQRARTATPLAFASLCLVAVGVHSLVEFPLWYGYVLLPVALLMGMLDRARWPAGPVDPAQSVEVLEHAASTARADRTEIQPRRPARALVWLVGGLGWFGVVVVNVDYARVTAGFAAFQGVDNLASVSSPALHKPKWTLLPDFFDYFQAIRLQPQQPLSPADLALLERVSLRFAYVHVLNNLAEAYVVNGQGKQALRTMQTLHSLHPFSWAGYYAYWKQLAAQDARFQAIFQQLPAQ